VYPSGYFSAFSPAREFVKWAAVEVTNVDQMPPGMEVFTLPDGLYAVFHFKGPAHNPAIFQYIYSTWLPGSGYVLDDRPHFEVLGEKYSNHDPESEEEIWIPVKRTL
jgi:AraC family transcriptional regulator